MKVFERAVNTHLSEFVRDHSSMFENQSGFRQSHSTCTALLDVTNTILSNMGKGLLTGAVNIDLKKAFDTVDHATLLNKLNKLGIHGTKLRWLDSYLTDREQCVRHGCNNSDFLPVSYSVPQGCILGPSLFSPYVNDLPLHVKQYDITLYADDTLLLFVHKDLYVIKPVLESNLANATFWLKENKLHLNVSNTKWTLSSTQKRRHGVMYPYVTVNGQELERVNQYKYLRVFLDTCLDWNDHIGVTAGKISQRLGVLGRVRRHLTLDTAKMLYNSLVLPLFDYCDMVIGNLNKTNLRRLQKLQNRGGRIILKADSRTHIMTLCLT